MLSAKPWRGEAVIIFLCAQLFCFCVGAVIATFLSRNGSPPAAMPESFGAVLVSTLSFQGMTCLLIFPFLREHRMSWREGFGLDQGGWWVGVVFAAALTIVVILPMAWSLQMLSASFMERIGVTPEEQTAVKLLSNAAAWSTQIYLAVFTIAIAPVAEEFVFRGVLYPFVKQRGYPRLAWLGVSFLFALIHMDVAILLPLFVLALILTWLYELTDSLIAPIAAHSVFNTANLLVLYYNKQLDHLLQRLSHMVHF